MQHNKSALATSWAAFLVAAVAVGCIMNYHQANSSPVAVDKGATNNEQPEPLEQDEDGVMMVPYVADCGADEESRPGTHPSCEPTCANPNPICIKIYFLDYVPCFCKAPLVRDTKSKKCVQKNDCPAKCTKSHRA